MDIAVGIVCVVSRMRLANAIALLSSRGNVSSLIGVVECGLLLSSGKFLPSISTNRLNRQLDDILLSADLSWTGLPILIVLTCCVDRYAHGFSFGVDCGGDSDKTAVIAFEAE